MRDCGFFNREDGTVVRVCLHIKGYLQMLTDRKNRPSISAPFQSALMRETYDNYLRIISSGEIFRENLTYKRHLCLNVIHNKIMSMKSALSPLLFRFMESNALRKTTQRSEFHRT